MSKSRIKVKHRTTKAYESVTWKGKGIWIIPLRNSVQHASLHNPKLIYLVRNFTEQRCCCIRSREKVLQRACKSVFWWFSIYYMSPWQTVVLLTLRSFSNHRLKNDNYMSQYLLQWCLTFPHPECWNHKKYWPNISFFHAVWVFYLKCIYTESNIWNICGTRSHAVLDNYPGLRLPTRLVQILKEIRPCTEGHSFLHMYNPVKKLTYCFLVSLFNDVPLDELRNNFKF